MHSEGVRHPRVPRSRPRIGDHPPGASRWRLGPAVVRVDEDDRCARGLAPTKVGPARLHRDSSGDRLSPGGRDVRNRLLLGFVLFAFIAMALLVIPVGLTLDARDNASTLNALKRDTNALATILANDSSSDSREQGSQDTHRKQGNSNDG